MNKETTFYVNSAIDFSEDGAYSLVNNELELHQLYKINIENNKVKLVKVDYYE